MRFGTHLALALALLPLAARADEKLPALRAGSVTYSNITVTTVSATDVYFTYSGGMGNAKLKDLSPDLQQHYKYDPSKAKAAEQKQAENKLKYHEQLLHQTAAQAPDMTRDVARDSAPGATAWRTDLPGALKQAQSENKMVLLDFTGSDWCPWCIKFDQDVLSTGKFNAYAGQKLQLVKVDFPQHTQLPDDLQRANNELARTFHVDGYPTYVLLDSAGKELGRQVGYLEGGPDAFIAELDRFGHK
ncbi:MAG TPA: thioredoxin fold domain-containing protein [Candidatus Acidoferrales bacterium]|jgi:thiol-disulfide isomerase/thioredoxin|nr:thioredoxin fold domain-containing protein [Candidatus Acidoferrales bacterium]